MVSRFLLGYPSWLFLLYSINHMPIGLAQTIQNLSPFMTLILGYLILKETLRSMEIVNMCVSFSGVLLMIYFSTQSSQQDETSTTTTAQFITAVFLNSLAAFFLSLINVIIRQLKTVHYSVAAWFQAFMAFVCSLICLVFYRLWINPDYDYSTLTQFDYWLMVANGTV